MANKGQRRPNRVRTKSIGVHGPLIMGALYRLGCATAEELAAIVGLDRRKVNQQLLTLLGDGYVERLCAWPSWRNVTKGGPPHIYYLSPRLGVPCGAGEVGVEDEDAARQLYRRCRVPAHYSHRELGTAFVALLASACRLRTDVTLTDYWAEHAPDFPWRRSSPERSYASGIGAGLKYGDIQPDGSVQSEIDLGDDAGFRKLRMVLEIETGSRNIADAVAKTKSYCTLLESRCRTGGTSKHPQDPRGPEYFSEPPGGWPAITFVCPTDAEAARMQKRVETDLEEDAAYQAWVGRMQMQHNVDPAWFILFVGLDAAESSEGTLGHIYHPLEQYYDQSGDPLRVVWLRDIAFYAAWAARQGLSGKEAG